MPDGDPTTLALRISRPFSSEEEFLQHELDALTRTTILLRGAPARPKGVVLRFEVALAAGGALLRGEGRVLAYRPPAPGVDSGLTLRFTRLDARSKALVDRAAVLREARTRAALDAAEARGSIPPPAASMDPARTSPELEPKTEPKLEVAAPSVPVMQPQAGAHVESPAASRPSSPPPPPPTSGVVSLPTPPAAISGETLSSARPVRREELLDRLRQRAKTLSPTAVEQLLGRVQRS